MADNNSNTSTNINFTKAETTISEWNQAADAFSSSYKKASEDPCIQDLQSAGLESGFASSYDKRFDDLAQNIKTMSTELSTVIQEFYNTDVSTPTPTYVPTNPGGNNPTNPGGNNPTNPGGNNPTPTSTPTPTPTATPEDHDKVYDKMVNEFGSISMEGLDGLSAELVKYAAQNGISVDELLSNSKYATKLHSLLLKSSNLSEDLKKLITESSTSVTQEVLRDIYSGKFPSIVGLNDDTSSIYLAYLQAIAKKLGVSVQDLVTDPKYQEHIDSSFKEFSKVSGMFNGMSDEEIIDRALKIYDGNDVDEVDEETMNILRAYMDTEAKDRNKDVQELSKEDAELFKNLSKFGSMAAVMVGASTDTIQNALVNIVESKNTPTGSANATTQVSQNESTTTETAVTRSTTQTESSTQETTTEPTQTSETIQEQSTSEVVKEEPTYQEEINPSYSGGDEQTSEYVEEIIPEDEHAAENNPVSVTEEFEEEIIPEDGEDTSSSDGYVENIVSEEDTQTVSETTSGATQETSETSPEHTSESSTESSETTSDSDEEEDDPLSTIDFPDDEDEETDTNKSNDFESLLDQLMGA